MFSPLDPKIELIFILRDIQNWHEGLILNISNKCFIHRHEIDIDIGYDHPATFFLDLSFNVG